MLWRNTATLHPVTAEFETRLILGERPLPLPRSCSTEKGRQVSAATRSLTAQKNAADILPVIQSIQAAGVTTLKGLASELNTRSIPAPRGGSWSAVQVSRILSRGSRPSGRD